MAGAMASRIQHRVAMAMDELAGFAHLYNVDNHADSDALNCNGEKSHRRVADRIPRKGKSTVD